MSCLWIRILKDSSYSRNQNEKVNISCNNCSGLCTVIVIHQQELLSSPQKFPATVQNTKYGKVYLHFDRQFSEAQIDKTIIEDNIKDLLQQVFKIQKFITLIQIAISSQYKVAAMLKTYPWRFIREIRIIDSIIGDNVFLNIMNSDNYHYLSKLLLSENKLELKSIKRLIKSDFYFLKQLNISHNPIGNRGIKIILRANMPKLRELQIWYNNTNARVFRYLDKISTRKQKMNVSISVSNNNWQTDSFVTSLGFQSMFVTTKERYESFPGLINPPLVAKKSNLTDNMLSGIKWVEKYFTNKQCKYLFQSRPLEPDEVYEFTYLLKIVSQQSSSN